MSNFAALIAAAPPRLLVWLRAPVAEPFAGEPVDRAALRVKPVVQKTELRLKLFADTVKRVADEWTTNAQSGGHVIDWSTVTDQDVRGTMLPDILETFGNRLQRNYNADERVLLDALLAYRDDQRKAELTGISIWTDAPKDYDHGYARRTGESYTPGLTKKTLYRVVVPTQEQVEWQSRRYGSGLHAAFDDARMEQERAYDAKRAAVAPFEAEAGTLRKLLDTVQKQLRMHYDSQAGYWKAGVFAPRYDEQSRRSYPYPVSEAELPPADVTAAARTLADMRRRFQAMPEVARKEHWKIGADIDDLLRQAGRQVREKMTTKRERAKATAAKDRRQAKARVETIARLEAAGVPQVPDLVLVGLVVQGASAHRDGDWVPIRGFGRITSWPPGASTIETTCGPVKIPFDDPGWSSAVEGYNRLGVIEGPRFDVPRTVWTAGVLPPIGMTTTENGKVVFAARQGIFYADGSKVPANTKAHAAGTAALRGDEDAGKSQDQILDAGLYAYLDEFEPAPGWGPTRTVARLPVQYHPPPQVKKGSVKGWKVRARITRDGAVGWIIFTREMKKHPEAGYWQHPPGEAFVPDTALNLWLDGLPKHERTKALAFLLADPRQTQEDAQQHLWGRA